MTINLHSTSARSTFFLLASLGFGILHHLDHVLRADHSGWPFTPTVTPFTFSLLAYPLLLTALFVSRPWVRIGAVGLVLGFTQLAHTFIETPRDQFHTWACGTSDLPGTVGQPNLLGIHSSSLGYLAVTISIMLSLMLLGAFISLVLESRRQTLAHLWR